MTAVTVRQLQLLRVVHDGGERDARSIDITMSSRHGPSHATVRCELLELAGAGLVEVEGDRGVGGTWTLTPLGRDILASSQQE